MQTPAFRSCHRSIRGIRVCITTGGDILAVSSCSLVPSPPCDWNVNSKPLKRAASKPTQGSWQVGSKWSRQQEDTSTFYALTLSVALQIFQSTHNLRGRPWLGCPDTWRMSLQPCICTSLCFPEESGFGIHLVKRNFSLQGASSFCMQTEWSVIKDSSVMVLWPKGPSSVQFNRMNSPHNLVWPQRVLLRERGYCLPNNHSAELILFKNSRKK